MYNIYLNHKMSIAHLNPENRTMNNLVQLPNNRRIALTRSTHRCSFCLTQGHNINTCDDNRLIYIENECMQQKQLCSFDENAIILFRNWLCAKVLHNSLLIKAFAVRKCGARIRSNIDECIENIVNYIYQDSNNNTYKAQYNKNVLSVEDIVYYPENNQIYEHPFEKMAIEIENKYK